MIKAFRYICLCSFFFGCDAVIEVEDISNDSVTILAPLDNSILQTNTINFSWEALEFAETYQLQIAIPNFDAAEVIVEDTIISSTSYSKVLEASNYQWRIRALNFAYDTQYTTQNLTVED